MSEDIRERFRRLPPEALEGAVIPREREGFIEFVEGDSHYRFRIKVLRGLALTGTFLCGGGVGLLLALPGQTVAQWIGVAFLALLGLWCLASFQRLGSTPPPRFRYFRLHLEKERFIPCEHCGVPRSLDWSAIRAFLYFRDARWTPGWSAARVHIEEEDPQIGIPEAPRPRRRRSHSLCCPVPAESYTEQAYLVTVSGAAYPLFREEPDRRTGINVVKALGELTGRPALYLETRMLSDRLARHAREGRFTEEALERAEEIREWEQ